MKRLPLILLYGGLFGAAAVAAFATRAGPERPDSPLASVRNPGPAGAQAAFTYLSERGHRVATLDGPLTALPKDAKTVVLAAPSVRAPEDGELDALFAFVEGGGRVVYLAPRAVKPKWEGLSQRLSLAEGPSLAAAPLAGERDPGGATAFVWSPAADADGSATPLEGPLAGVRELRVLAEDTVTLPPPALPIAGTGVAPALWAVPRGEGAFLVAAGADLLENRRLELSDNLQLWENLAGEGPLYFDEYHHGLAAPVPVSRSLYVLFAQLAFVALVFFLVEGTRLGPPRPTPQVRHRSTVEYVRSLSHLFRRAHVEGELCQRLFSSFRARCGVSLGLAPDLSTADFAARLAEALSLPERELAGLFADAEAAARAGATPATFLSLTQRFAALDARLDGRGAG